MTDFYHDEKITIYNGDALEVLKTLSDETVNCVVTSPPYWGLRDYGVSGQLGLEKTPEKYVERLVGIFREIKRVLRDDGTVWLNLGDSYAGSWDNYQPTGRGGQREKQTQRFERKAYNNVKFLPPTANCVGLKPKDLVGIPWRVAFALQADGWYLRSDIIWAKPNPMPESVTDRPTKAHEYIFLLSKSQKYFYDGEAIKEDATPCVVKHGPHTKNWQAKGKNGFMNTRPARPYIETGSSKNKRTVWKIPTKPFPEAHFAVYPEELILPCVKAGCPEWVCTKCGFLRERIIQSNTTFESGSGKSGKKPAGKYVNKEGSGIIGKGLRMGPVSHIKTTGWTSCDCNSGWQGGVVLDPFMGAGTTLLVALKTNRKAIGIELKKEYCEMTLKRLKPHIEQLVLL